MLSLLALACLPQLPLLDQQPSQLDSRSAHDTFFATADNFQVSDPAGFDLGSVVWWGSWASAGAAVGDSFDLYVHQDTVGPFGIAPGTVIASYPGVFPTVATTGLSFPSFAGSLPEHRLEYSLPAPLHLSTGIYWLEIVCTGSSLSGEEFVWEMAPQDPVNGVSCMAWSLDTPGVTWFSCTPFGESDMSLQLSESSGPQLSYSGLVGGGTVVATVSGATPFSTVFLGYSLTGSGPTNTAFGMVAMSPPIKLLTALTTDSAGGSVWSSPVPPSASGRTLYSQGVDLASGALTNPVAELVL